MVTLHLVAVLAVGVPCDSRGEGCEELASRGWWGTWVVWAAMRFLVCAVCGVGDMGGMVTSG